ncbi:MAG: hypothetical protein Aurels2KO_51940 [Aureliella sp.]
MRGGIDYDSGEIDKEIADIMQLSSYSVIHLESRDSYWGQSQMGGLAEYFRRNPD